MYQQKYFLMQVIIDFPEEQVFWTTVPKNTKKIFEKYHRLMITLNFLQKIRHDLIHHIHDLGASINWGTPSHHPILVKFSTK